MTEPAKKLIETPVDLMEDVKAKAAEQGTSANALIVILIASGLGWKLESSDRKVLRAVTKK